jgi:hypothetical protein
MCLLIIYICVSIFYCGLHFTVCGPFFCGSYFMLSQSFTCVSHFMLSQSFSSCMSIFKLFDNHFMLSQSFTCCVLAILFLCQLFSCCDSHSVFSQSFYLFYLRHFICACHFRLFQPCNKSPFLFHIVENVDSCVIQMHLVDLLPRKIVKTPTHLATMARDLEGEHIKLLSREVLGKLM